MSVAFLYIYKEERGWKDLNALRSSIQTVAIGNGDRVDNFVVQYADAQSEGPNLESIFRSMRRKDSLYIEDISRLGSSFSAILGNLHYALTHGIKVYGVSDNFSLDYGFDIRSYEMALKHISGIYSSFLSKRTMLALQKKKKEGMKLGRPAGTSVKMDVLLQNSQEIRKALKDGAIASDICQRYDVSLTTFKRFCKLESGMIL